MEGIEEVSFTICVAPRPLGKVTWYMASPVLSDISSWIKLVNLWIESHCLQSGKTSASEYTY